MSKVNPRVSNPGFPPLPASTGLYGRPPDANKSVPFMGLDWSGVQSASDGFAAKSSDVAKDIVMGGDDSDGGALHGDDTVRMGVDQSGVVGGRKVSFKDMVLGNNGISQSALMVPDLDVDVRDEDVSIVNFDGTTTINFSKRVHDLIDAKLANSVVVRLLGRSIGFSALETRIKALWQLHGAIALIDLDNGYFLARFALFEDFSRVLSGGPWVIYGSYLTVQPWSRKIVKIDSNTSEGLRGRFARLAVVVDLTKPLPSTIIIDGHKQRIEYEGLPTICFSCGKYGHLEASCKSVETVASRETDSGIIKGATTDQDKRFGPWMQVQNRKPHRSTTLRYDRGTIAGRNNSVVGVGIFAALDSSEALDELHNFEVFGDRGKAILNSQIDSSVSKAKYAGRVLQQKEGSLNIKGTEPKGSTSVSTETASPATVSLVEMNNIRQASPVASPNTVVPVQISLDSRKHTAVKVVEKPVTAFDGRGVIRKEGGRSLSGPARVQRFSKVKGDARQNPYVQRRKSIDNAENNDPKILHLGDWIQETYSKLALEASSSGIDAGVVAKVGDERDGRLPLCDDGDDTGALHPTFNRFLRMFVHQHDPDIVSLFEPRISGRKADQIIRRHGFLNSFRVEASRFSGGIWLQWKDFISIDIMAISNQFIHTAYSDARSDFKCIITFVYASPNVRRCHVLWDQLEALNPGSDIPWVLGGDFNSIISSTERVGGSLRRSGVCRRFRDFILQLNLTDLGCEGPRFTWKRGNLQQRLDRCIVNDAWCNTWSLSSVFNLARLGSDHRPVLLRCLPSTQRISRSFRYLAAWQTETSFNNLLKDVWNPDESITVNIVNFHKAVQTWNVNVFGCIGKRKREILARIAGIERKLEYSMSDRLIDLEHQLKCDLDLVLRQEESLWFQRSRCQWIQDGDRNTKYYHRVTKTRQ
ncbi:hypothetical protein GQ457_04G010410 [Hibiscus cannabinus]